uniref:restriction endonuclease n=1 Tax=Streptomyces sp. S501 TaxID=2420135 RepID=UPI001F0D4E83|nr:restriction endonuclease [Streptomyces sp. S501]
MWFEDPGHVSDVTIRPAAMTVLAKMPSNQRAGWQAALEEARKDILGSGTVLHTREYAGTYDHKYDSWNMPTNLGIGISAVDDGRAIVRLVQYGFQGLDTIGQVVSYINCSRLFHQVTVGEILPAGSRPRYTSAGYDCRLREIDEAYRTLKKAVDAPTGREGRYRDLLRLAEFLKEQASALSQPEAARANQLREVPDWFALSPAEFEREVAELCRKDGCIRVQAVGKAGDLGADVIAHTPDGRKVVIQCKQYRGKVSSPDLQKFAGTVFQIHRADVALLVTTGTLTAPAASLAKAAGIGIVHADLLDRWASGQGTPPWDA